MTHISTLPSPESVRAALKPSRSDLLRAVPEVPKGFYGTISYQFKDGKLLKAEVAETFVPE
jgi:hypothetical protein